MEEKNANDNWANPLKRKRLSTACNRCRSRKLRCDDRLHSCTNCHRTSSECITQDPRQPHVRVERREAQSLAQSPLKSTTSRGRSKSTSQTADTHLRASSTEALSEAGPARPRYYHEATVGLFSGPLPAIPVFRSGNCLFTLTQWLDFAFARIGLPERFSWQYNAARVRSTDHTIGGDFFQPDARLGTGKELPELSTFLSNMNLVFPLIDSEDVLRIQATEPAFATAEETAATAGSILQHLLLAGGSRTVDKSGNTDNTSHILAFAFSNLPTLVQDGSIDSVKSLLLMALLLRNRDEIEMAWRMLAISVSKAQALALDRRYPAHRRSDETRTAHRQQANTWWSLFILDKVLALELQRPPMIRDCFYDQELFQDSDQSRVGQTKKRCFGAVVDLARIQGRICERLLECTQVEESGRLTLSQAIRAKLQAAGELDQLLLDWVKLLPEDLKPAEYPSCDTVVLPAVAFLTIQYYQTLFLVHRNSLLINPHAIKAEVEAHFGDASYRLRLQSSVAICMNAARSIISVLNHLLEENASFALHSLYSPLVSVYALAIHIMKNPTVGSAKTDLEILASAARIIQRHESRRADEPSSISTMVSTLHAQVSTRVNAHANGPTITSLRDEARQEATPEVSTSGRPTHGANHNMNHLPFHHTSDKLFLHDTAAFQMTVANMDMFNNGFEGTEMDWNTMALTLDLPSF